MASPAPATRRAARDPADLLAGVLFLSIPLVASPRFWDQFMTVKWYALQALTALWLVVECFQRQAWPAWLGRVRVLLLVLASLAGLNLGRQGWAWGLTPLLDRTVDLFRDSLDLKDVLCVHKPLKVGVGPAFKLLTASGEPVDHRGHPGHLEPLLPDALDRAHGGATRGHHVLDDQAAERLAHSSSSSASSGSGCSGCAIATSARNPAGSRTLVEK